MRSTTTLPHMFANLNWKDVLKLREKKEFVLLFPMGSTEAHGPHGPLSTDISISLEVCLRSAEILNNSSYKCYILPPLAYSVTHFALGFPGSISISAVTETSLISDICLSLIDQSMDKILIFNSHFDPGHVKCIYDAIDNIFNISGVGVDFTDITRKRYSSMLTESFRKGETHADRYETSLIMAIDPDLVDEDRRISLPYLPMNLAHKIFVEKVDNFIDMGMNDCYCGDPAAASIEEGEQLFAILCDLVVNDVKAMTAGSRTLNERGLYSR